MSYDDTVKAIVAAAGGKDNIQNAWHCMTRLRFRIKDEGAVDLEGIGKIPGVLGTKFASGQLQVVVGTEVESYFAALAQLLGLKDGEESGGGEEEEKKGIVGVLMDTVSGIFGPLVPAIAGAGMIKGLMAGLVAIGAISNASDTYVVLDMIASGVFTFLPFFIAYSAARIFKTNPFVAVAIAAAMQYPSMTAAAAAGEVDRFMLFGFLPVPVASYAGNVIPIIFAVWALSYIYRWIDKVLPRVMRTVFTPTISLFIAGILAFVAIGPLGTYLGNLLGYAIQWMFAASPILAGAIFGAIRPIAVFTGLHHAMTPIALQNFQTQGWDQLMPMMFMANMAMMGATLAMYFKVKDADERSNIGAAAVSVLLGITEPALFGVLAKYRKAFIAATIGSAVASAFFAITDVRIYGYILSSIFSLVAYVGPYFPLALVGIALAAGVSFGVTWVMIPSEEDAVEDSSRLVLKAAVDGTYVPLEDVSDPIVAEGHLGKGFAIEPSGSKVVAPVAGTLTAVFPTGHAYGITTSQGIEVLVHLGVDTVDLKGKGFTPAVKTGQKVKAGDLLCTMDADAIRAAGKDPVAMVIVTNGDQVLSMEPADKLEGVHHAGDAMLDLSLA